MTSTAPPSPVADIAGGRYGYRLLWPAMFVQWLLAYADRSIIGLLVTWMLDHDVAFMQTSAQRTTSSWRANTPRHGEHDGELGPLAGPLISRLLCDVTEACSSTMHLGAALVSLALWCPSRHARHNTAPAAVSPQPALTESTNKQTRQ